jgi:hypothetical protein
LADIEVAFFTELEDSNKGDNDPLAPFLLIE